MGLDWTLRPPPRADAVDEAERLQAERDALFRALVEVENERVLKDGLDPFDAAVDADRLEAEVPDHNPARKVLTLGLDMDGWDYSIFTDTGEPIEVTRREDRIGAYYEDEPLMTLEDVAEEGYSYIIDQDGDLARYRYPEPFDIGTAIKRGVTLLNPSAHLRRRRSDGLVADIERLNERQTPLMMSSVDVLDLEPLGQRAAVDERFRARLEWELSRDGFSPEEIDARYREHISAGKPHILTTPYDDALPICWGMKRLWFRGQQASYAASELGDEALAKRCWKPIVADEAIAMAEQLEQCAGGAAPDRAGAADMVNGAARWLRFWGGQGFGVDPWF